MKPHLGNRAESGLTLLELTVIVCVLVLLAALLIPVLRSAKIKAGKITCNGRLKQIGISFRIWEGDNREISPMGISVTNGGSMEMAATGDVVQTFMVMSNELAETKILVCPADDLRFWAGYNATNFTQEFNQLSRSNISYYVGIEVTNDANPQLFLSGDGDFEIAAQSVKLGVLSLRTNDPVTWSAGRHSHFGNLGLADGSVQSATDLGLRNYLLGTGVATNRLAIP